MLHHVGRGALVFGGAPLAQAIPGNENEEIAPILFGEDGIEEWIGTRIDGIEEDQEKFGFGHVDEWMAQEGGERKEGNGRPTGKIGEHEQGHSFGDLCVINGGSRLLAPYRDVHL